MKKIKGGSGGGGGVLLFSGADLTIRSLVATAANAVKGEAIVLVSAHGEGANMGRGGPSQGSIQE